MAETYLAFWSYPPTSSSENDQPGIWTPSSSGNLKQAAEAAHLHLSPYTGTTDIPKMPDHAFILVPHTPLADSLKTLNVERMLKSIKNYCDSFVISQTTHATLLTPTESSKKQALWSEMKFGIYFLKIQSPELAWPALSKACSIAPGLFTKTESFDFEFIKELFSTLSPVNTRVCLEVRKLLLQYLSSLAHRILEPSHPISVICHELQQDDHNRAVSERALESTFHAMAAHFGRADDRTFQTERAMIALLRRDGDLEPAYHSASTLAISTAKRLRSALGKPLVCARALRQARLAASELAHVYMDQKKYHEAYNSLLNVVTGRINLLPREDLRGLLHSTVSSFIPDSQSLYAMKDIAKVENEMGNIDERIWWLAHAAALSVSLLGGKDESNVTAHIVDELSALQK